MVAFSSNRLSSITAESRRVVVVTCRVGTEKKTQVNCLDMTAAANATAHKDDRFDSAMTMLFVGSVESQRHFQDSFDSASDPSRPMEELGVAE